VSAEEAAPVHPPQYIHVYTFPQQCNYAKHFCSWKLLEEKIAIQPKGGEKKPLKDAPSLQHISISLQERKSEKDHIHWRV
jgi:hypothetical protein